MGLSIFPARVTAFLIFIPILIFARGHTDNMHVLDFNTNLIPFKTCLNAIILIEGVSVQVRPILDHPILVVSISSDGELPFNQKCYVSHVCRYNTTQEMVRQSPNYKLMIMKYNCVSQYVSVEGIPGAYLSQRLGRPIEFTLRFLSTRQIEYPSNYSKLFWMDWLQKLKTNARYPSGDQVLYRQHSYIHFIFPTSVQENSIEELKGTVFELITGKHLAELQNHKIYFVLSPKKIIGLVGFHSTLKPVRFYDVRLDGVGAPCTDNLNRQHIQSIKDMSGGGFRIKLQDGDWNKRLVPDGSPIINTNILQVFTRSPYFWSAPMTKERRLNLLFLSAALSRFPNSTLVVAHLKGSGKIASATIPVYHPRQASSYYFKMDTQSYSFINCEELQRSRLSFSGFLSPFQWDLWAGLLLSVSILIVSTMWLLKTFAISRFPFMIFCILLEQGISIPVKLMSKFSFILLLAPFLLLSIIFTNCYKSIVTTDLLAPRPYARPETFEELAKSGYSIIVTPDAEHTRSLFECWEALDMILGVPRKDMTYHSMCYDVAKSHIHIYRWIFNQIKNGTSERGRNYNILYNKTHVFYPTYFLQQEYTVLNCTNRAYVLPENKIRATMLKLRSEPNGNISRLYKAKASIAEIDTGLEITDMDGDGGIIQSEVRHVIDAGIHRKWEEHMENYGMVKLENKAHLLKKDGPTALDLGSSNMVAIFYCFLLGVGVSIFGMTIECETSAQAAKFKARLGLKCVEIKDLIEFCIRKIWKFIRIT